VPSSIRSTTLAIVTASWRLEVLWDLVTLLLQTMLLVGRPMVEHTFTLASGSLFTHVELRTPDDRSIACNYLRRQDSNPVCNSVNPTAAVELPQ
jgi:hypothetical protein